MKTLLLFLISLNLAFAASEQPAGMAWEIVSSGPASVAVPKGWRDFDGMQPTMVIFRQGDGIGVPFMDESGAPLQLGLTVEKFAPTTDSTETIAKKTAAGASRDPRLQPLGEDQLEPVVLSDQTEGTLLSKQFIKSVHRRSLQMKLVIKDAESGVWVVSGYVVAGKESQLPTPDSRLAKWLRAHILSATLTGKEVEQEALETAYRSWFEASDTHSNQPKL